MFHFLKEIFERPLNEDTVRIETFALIESNDDFLSLPDFPAVFINSHRAMYCVTRVIVADMKMLLRDFHVGDFMRNSRRRRTVKWPSLLLLLEELHQECGVCGVTFPIAFSCTEVANGNWQQGQSVVKSGFVVKKAAFHFFSLEILKGSYSKLLENVLIAVHFLLKLDLNDEAWLESRVEMQMERLLNLDFVCNSRRFWL